MAIANYQPEYSDLSKPREVKVIDSVAIAYSDVVVHHFPMGDVEDPDLYASQPLYDWQQSEAGAWVMAHAVEPPFWTRQADIQSYGYRYYIVARLKEQDQTFWSLKWCGLSK
jgi:hypothetical protein